MSQISATPLGQLDVISAAQYGTHGYPHEAWTRLRREARIALRKIRTEDAEGATVQRLAAEVEQLREQLRYHGDRIDAIDKRAP